MYLIQLSFLTLHVGRTPWGTWISCEEVNDDGQIWEVHPEGKRIPRKTVLGGEGGRFESFTYDIRNKQEPKFYYTEDLNQGALRQFTPKNFSWDNPHLMLHGEGDIKYLVLTPTSANNATGTYHWTSNKREGMRTASEFFPGSEGIDVYEGMLFFVTKKRNLMYTLDLDSNRWERRSTKWGVFDGSPDQLARVVGDEEILYYTEVSLLTEYGRLQKHDFDIYFSLYLILLFFLVFKQNRREVWMLAFMPVTLRDDSLLFWNRQCMRTRVRG